MVLTSFFSFIIHIDAHLNSLIISMGHWIYILLFGIIFLETGIVVTPFLPGDSLLFSAGAFAAIGSLNIYVLLIILFLAAVIGDSLNYYIGGHFGPRFFRKETGLVFNKKYMESTEKFYHKHGGKAIILARFIPIIRTFAPFVAGIGKMNYKRFLTYNILGAFLWVGVLTMGGYLFGNIPFIKNNFSLFIIAIIIISIMPIIYEGIVHIIRRIKNN